MALHLLLHFFENGKGNSKNSLTNNFLNKFLSMRNAFERFVNQTPRDDDCPIEPNSASGLWT